MAGIGNTNGDTNGSFQCDDVIVGAKRADKNSLTDNGAVYIVVGSNSSGSTISLSTADTMLAGESDGDESGINVSGIDDLDGDNIPEFIVGSYKNNSEIGAVQLVMSTDF